MKAQTELALSFLLACHSDCDIPNYFLTYSLSWSSMAILFSRLIHCVLDNYHSNLILKLNYKHCFSSLSRVHWLISLITFNISSYFDTTLPHPLVSLKKNNWCFQSILGRYGLSLLLFLWFTFVKVHGDLSCFLIEHK